MEIPDESHGNTNDLTRLSLVMDDRLLSRFFILLQQGVMVSARIGCSVETFLREELGAQPDTIEKIQSVFLDGSPVDDLDTAIIKAGSVLALSAAMPGLVGATLRRGGTYSSFRNTITYHETSAHCASGEGFVQIKLFNLLMGELGHGLLRRGVFVKSSTLAKFLAEQPQDFWQGCRQALLDSKTLQPQMLLDSTGVSRRDRVFLSVTVPEPLPGNVYNLG